jgi:hypothetical protein
MNLPEKPSPAAIAAKTLADIAWNPIVYLPYAGAAMVNAFLSLPLWVPLGAAATITVGQIWWWKQNWAHIFEKHEAEMEKEYRARWNKSLREQISIKGKNWLVLLDILGTKAKIEEHIFSDKRISQKERELLDLIETTTLQAAETTEAGRESGTASKELFDTRKALQELSENLGFVLKPLSPTETEKVAQTQSGLAESTRALRRQMEDAKGVRELVEDIRPRTKA